MLSSAEVNSIKQSWLYGRAQQRGIELREIWKKTRNLNMLTGIVQHKCTGMHSTQWQTPPVENLQQKKTQNNRILEI